MKTEPKYLIDCLMCFGFDKETQERLKGRAPRKDCSMCRGKGKLAPTFRAGLESNEIRTTGKTTKSGFQIVIIDNQYNTEIS